MINYPERLKEMTAGMGKLGKVIPGTVQALGSMHQTRTQVFRARDVE